ncbi:hypothetical protein F0562_007009 [Nyssa sinensis]|uniref:Alpha-1,3/1,6-mannosyltransferase ALG2 n=1 Tax=Nyssa sinensis TaxID=561372 RepID=A0A5J5A706_9ASTE|nr:hypothetical protein F0562_007009 [Nyssa sinensis]
MSKKSGGKDNRRKELTDSACQSTGLDLTLAESISNISRFVRRPVCLDQFRSAKLFSKWVGSGPLSVTQRPIDSRPGKLPIVSIIADCSQIELVYSLLFQKNTQIEVLIQLQEVMETKGGSKMNIAIIHPDLGIGGAERLIVDAAVELASYGHNVHIFTAHHDKTRCFEETLAGTFPVTVYGAFLPRHIFYRFHAVFSVVIPLMKLKKSAKVVFYCHFPDLLLAQHSTFLRMIYRKPIDYIEEMTTGMADLILVNSKFTASTFANTFKQS